MKVLIIEDDTFFREYYSYKLQESKIEVAVAVDGEEGLQKVTAFQPDVILLDLIMPKKDGFEVLAALSANPQTKSIPVLVFSTLGQEGELEKIKQLGATGYVNKSFHDFDNLLKNILAIKDKGKPTQ